jgi:hypothetical protein
MLPCRFSNCGSFDAVFSQFKEMGFETPFPVGSRAQIEARADCPFNGILARVLRRMDRDSPRLRDFLTTSNICVMVEWDNETGWNPSCCNKLEIVENRVRTCCLTFRYLPESIRGSFDE